jgi:murein L,D-transpeptidase YcbB/YkuD
MADLYNAVNRMQPTNGITAHAGGGQASATQLTTQVNRVTTVATAADSVKLPAARAGDMIVVINADSADSLNVYPQSGEAINALGADAAFALAANKTAIFFCALAGQWNSVLTA